MLCVLAALLRMTQLQSRTIGVEKRNHKIDWHVLFWWPLLLKIWWILWELCPQSFTAALAPSFPSIMDFSRAGHLPCRYPVVTKACERDQALALFHLNYSFSRGWMCSGTVLPPMPTYAGDLRSLLGRKVSKEELGSLGRGLQHLTERG